MFTASEGRWGSREIEIRDVRLLSADGTAKHVFRTGEPVTIFPAAAADATSSDT